MPSAPKRGLDRGSLADVYQPTLITGMLSAVYWFDDAVRQTQEAVGLPSWTRAQSFLVLNIMFGEHRTTRLAKRLGVSRQAVGRLVNEMVEMGVLATEPDPTDARALCVSIAPKTAMTHGYATVMAVHALEDYLSERVGARRLQAMREVLQADWGPPPTLSMAALKAAAARHHVADDPAAPVEPHVPDHSQPRPARKATRKG
jgi:DNA-binding MarR family transcriptional regulator